MTLNTQKVFRAWTGPRSWKRSTMTLKLLLTMADGVSLILKVVWVNYTSKTACHEKVLICPSPRHHDPSPTKQEHKPISRWNTKICNKSTTFVQSTIPSFGVLTEILKFETSPFQSSKASLLPLLLFLLLVVVVVVVVLVLLCCDHHPSSSPTPIH